MKETIVVSHGEETVRSNEEWNMNEEDGNKENHSDENNKSETLEWIKALAIAVIIAFVIRFFLFAPIVVDGESMLPTLYDSERLIVNKIVYTVGEPKRGDIIVFHATDDKDWIKRVIGEPGDTVELRDGVLYVNNEIFNEPYVRDQIQGSADFYTEVPEDSIFVMGDNRLNSRDSRNIGPIPLESVVGRADIVFWPLNETRLVNK